MAQVNAALGPPDVADDARAAMVAYYAHTEQADWFADAMLTSAEQVRSAITRFTDLGADEVMLYCWGRDPGQVDRFADVVA